jgi:hypothetical protein
MKKKKKKKNWLKGCSDKDTTYQFVAQVSQISVVGKVIPVGTPYTAFRLFSFYLLHLPGLSGFQVRYVAVNDSQSHNCVSNLKASWARHSNIMEALSNQRLQSINMRLGLLIHEVGSILVQLGIRTGCSSAHSFRYWFNLGLDHQSCT